MKLCIPLLLLSIFLTSCPKPNGTSDAFEGKWELDSYVAFTPEPVVINPGEIKWTFKSKDQSLKIENSIESKYTFIEPSGDYAYELGEGNKITVYETSFDYRFENGKLILSDQPELDGPTLTFNRLE